MLHIALLEVSKREITVAPSEPMPEDGLAILCAAGNLEVVQTIADMAKSLLESTEKLHPFEDFLKSLEAKLEGEARELVSKEFAIFTLPNMFYVDMDSVVDSTQTNPRLSAEEGQAIVAHMRALGYDY